MNAGIFQVAVAIVLALPLSANAIDQAYARKLELSGCTQVTELQGCDINKTKAQNANAGFGTAPSMVAASPYAGRWIATNASTSQTVATINIDKDNKVLVDGKPVAGKLSDGALVFKTGFITYTIQGDPRLAHENSWFDSDAQTTGPIKRL